jgi:hypothetical protein
MQMMLEHVSACVTEKALHHRLKNNLLVNFKENRLFSLKT